MVLHHMRNLQIFRYKRIEIFGRQTLVVDKENLDDASILVMLLSDSNSKKLNKSLTFLQIEIAVQVHQ
jgi:hypothetical protein